MSTRRESYNPLLKSYPDSERINAVSEGAEVLYVRLIAQSDDAGRYYADPQWVLAKLFTARMASGLTVAKVASRLDELWNVDLIRFYEVDGKRYLEMTEIKKSLRRDVKPQVFFPAPTSAPVAHPSRVRPASVTDALRIRPEPVANSLCQPNPATDPTQLQTQSNASACGKHLATAVSESDFPMALDTPDFRKAWDDWLAYRRSKRKPVSAVAGRRQLDDLATHGPTVAIEAIAASIRSDWQGLFPGKVPQGDCNSGRKSRSNDKLDFSGVFALEAERNGGIT